MLDDVCSTKLVHVEVAEHGQQVALENRAPRVPCKGGASTAAASDLPCALIDINMPYGDGFSVIDRLRAQSPEPLNVGP